MLIVTGSYFSSTLLFLSSSIIAYVYSVRSKAKGRLYLLFAIISYLIIRNMANKNINYRVLGVYIVLTISLGIIFALIMRRKEHQLNELGDRLISIEGNELLKNILELAIKDEHMTIEESTEKISKVIRSYYNVDYCSVFLKTNRGLNIVATNIDSQLTDYIEKFANLKFDEIRKETSEEIAASITCGDESLTYPTAAIRGIRYLNFIPLELGRKILGALMIEDRDRRKMEVLEEDFFTIVLENISIVLQNFIYKDKLVSAAMVDGLTQVWNRTYLERFMEDQIKAHKSNEKSFSVAILDIDHFKQFNDTYGHLHGDKVLKEISQFISRNIRKDEDIIARYGGEEFIIVFTRGKEEQIYMKIENLREKISRLDIIDDKGIKTPVTASFGMAVYPTNGLTTKDLINKADKALYYSKENGRNIVTKYNDILELQRAK